MKPDYWGGYYDLGIFYFRTARFDEALAQFQQVILLTPDNTAGYRRLGSMYYYLRNYENALAAWQRAQQIEPTRDVYSSMASVYYLEFQNYTEAARMYEKALALHDNDYRVWGYLATAYYWAEGERHKAADAWQRQVDQAQAQLAVNPRNQDVLVRLAKAHAHRGEHEKARIFLERAIAENPTLTSPLAVISVVYEVLNERDQALTWMARALDSGLPPRLVELDPWLRALRADPRYQRLLPQDIPIAP